MSLFLLLISVCSLTSGVTLGIVASASHCRWKYLNNYLTDSNWFFFSSSDTSRLIFFDSWWWVLTTVGWISIQLGYPIVPRRWLLMTLLSWLFLHCTTSGTKLIGMKFCTDLYIHLLTFLVVAPWRSHLWNVLTIIGLIHTRHCFSLVNNLVCD